MVPERWYEDGLRFACTRCGTCCTGAPGTVLVSEAEIATLRRHLEVDDEAFHGLYARRLPSGLITLREKSNGNCVFWKHEEGCTVYKHRPRQCRTWPYWRDSVASAETWDEAAQDCPGMNQGPLCDADTIEKTSQNDGTLSSASDE